MRRAEQAILGPRVALLRNAAVQDQFATMYVDRVDIAGFSFFFFSFFFFLRWARVKVGGRCEDQLNGCWDEERGQAQGLTMDALST